MTKGIVHYCRLRPLRACSSRAAAAPLHRCSSGSRSCSSSSSSSSASRRSRSDSRRRRRRCRGTRRPLLKRSACGASCSRSWACRCCHLPCLDLIRLDDTHLIYRHAHIVSGHMSSGKMCASAVMCVSGKSGQRATDAERWGSTHQPPRRRTQTSSQVGAPHDQCSGSLHLHMLKLAVT